ncbi:MAG: DUF6265 family protein [Myxococcota bacterium]
MISYRAISAFVFIAGGCAHQPPIRAPQPSFDFLVGHWLTDAGQMESWSRDPSLRAVSCRLKDGAIVIVERLRIEDRKATPELVASPLGQPETSFRWVSGDRNSATFENPEHDWPQRIVYRRAGNVLTAEVSAFEDETPRRWTWHRVQQPLDGCH